MLYQLEYPLHSSVKILYERLSTISGLSEWFADDVNINREGIYTFTWEGSSQDAELISKKKGGISDLDGQTQKPMNILNLEYKLMN